MTKAIGVLRLLEQQAIDAQQAFNALLRAGFEAPKARAAIRGVLSQDAR